MTTAKNTLTTSAAAKKRPKNDAQALSESMLTLSQVVTCLKNFDEDQYFTLSDLHDQFKERFKNAAISRDTLEKVANILESETNKPRSIFDFVLEKHFKYTNPHTKKTEFRLLSDWQDEIDAQGSNADNSRDQKRGSTYYYHMCYSITKAEIKLLTDAVSAFPMLTMDQTKSLLEDLNRLASDPKRRLMSNIKNDGYSYKLDDAQRADNIINSIDTVIKALKRKCCIAFDYYQYTTEKASASVYKLAFEQRSKQQIHPAFFVWSNGYYYLIGKPIGCEEKPPYVFRVDRIQNMTLLEKVKAQPFNINPAKYRDENPVMYGGRLDNIVLRIHRNRLNNAVDAFGKNFRIHPSDFIDPDTGEADQWIELHFFANPKGVALWATQHCTECRVLAPDSLIETVKNNLTKSLDLYQ